jgi:hypothetical protein
VAKIGRGSDALVGGRGAGSHGKTEKLKDGNTEKLKRRLEDAVTGRGLLVARGAEES